MCERPLLSIVITSYTMERFKDICELFDSIKRQTYSNLEVIFVAEHSRELYEKVKELVSRQSAAAGEAVSSQDLQTADYRLPTFKVLWNDGEPGLSAARNLGILNAKGDIIGFVDDDVVLFPNWAEEVVKSFDDDSIIGVTGPALPLWEDEKSMAWFPEEFYWIISCTAWFDCNERREVRNAWGMNMAFKKEAFELCGLFRNEYGFHKGLFAEDNEFSLRVKAKTGKKIIFCPEMRLWHRVHKYRISFKFIKERAYWIGRSRRNLRMVYATKESELLSLERALLRRIFTKLFPRAIKELVKSPRNALQTFSVAFVTLSFVAIGYLSCFASVKKT